jgi:sulfur transfer protein SufE
MSSSAWASRGKTIAGLIKELQAFPDQDIEVRISVDGCDSSVPISLVGKLENKYAILMNCEDKPTIVLHR